jgi:hypothetical protein
VGNGLDRIKSLEWIMQQEHRASGADEIVQKIMVKSAIKIFLRSPAGRGIEISRSH